MALEASGQTGNPKLQELGRKLAAHIVGFSSEFINSSEIPAALWKIQKDFEKKISQSWGIVEGIRQWIVFMSNACMVFVFFSPYHMIFDNFFYCLIHCLGELSILIMSQRNENYFEKCEWFQRS